MISITHELGSYRYMLVAFLNARSLITSGNDNDLMPLYNYKHALKPNNSKKLITKPISPETSTKENPIKA